MLSYAKARSYLPKNELTEAEALAKVKVGDTETEIFQPEQMMRLIEIGGHVEALQMLEQIRDYTQRHPDEPPPLRPVTFGSDNMRALIFNGREEEGLEAGRECCRRALGHLQAAGSHELARALHILAHFTWRAGKTEEALEHALQALDVIWRFEGPSTGDAMLALNALLSMQRKQGDTAGMLATQRDALRAFDMVLGPARPETHQQVARYARTLVPAG
jgi:hypothetical protein